VLINDVVDVCIIGSGPHALAALSALHEPLAQLTPGSIEFSRAKSMQTARRDRALKVCVVSPSGPVWLHDWEKRFKSLDITLLRSPAGAHPDMYSDLSLMEFARQHGREAECAADVGTRDSKELAGGISAGIPGEGSQKPLGRLVSLDQGLFDVPTEALFLDFCRSLARKLPHTVAEGYAQSIDQIAEDGRLRVQITGPRGGHVTANSVVVAIGAPGPSFVPSVFRDLPHEALPLVSHTNDSDRLNALDASVVGKRNVLVVGGGLSAVQAAIKLAKQGAHVVLATR
jgi:glycine/D-amino acid oxidase-like deaminating enzyme